MIPSSLADSFRLYERLGDAVDGADAHDAIAALLATAVAVADQAGIEHADVSLALASLTHVAGDTTGPSRPPRAVVN